MPKISIVTPCYNAQKYISQTIGSILEQNAVKSGRVQLEYIIVDGASSDGTIEIAKQYLGKEITIISEKDKGMYDALVKGFRAVTGDIVSYLNAGDLYFPWAFDVLVDIFQQERIKWVTGMTCNFNDQSQAVSVSLPYKYRPELIRRGMYGSPLPYIQQESTFWKSELLKVVDLQRLSEMKLAGDYFIWYELAKAHQLTIVSSLLGGFRIHPGQLSEDRGAYFDEMRKFIEKPGLLNRTTAMVDRLIWGAPVKIKKFANPDNLLLYDHFNKKWK